ncbi:MAG: spondin domain-containing protein [Candidatus Sericytochromatia bacterium]
MKLFAKTLMAVAALATFTATGFGPIGASQAEQMKPMDMMMMQNGVDYMVTFQGMWNEKTHPYEYPSGGALNPNGPHFSGLIGTTHNAGYMLFKEGMMPTPGLEKLSEEGAHSPLDMEIKQAMMAGKAGMMFATDFFLDVNAPKMFMVHASNAHPLVSVIGMIAPSPDWFFGVYNVNLMPGGKWADKVEMMAYAWDAGSDDGMSYLAADMNASPKKMTMMAKDKHFSMNGKPVAIGKFTFMKQK